MKSTVIVILIIIIGVFIWTLSLESVVALLFVAFFVDAICFSGTRR